MWSTSLTQRLTLFACVFLLICEPAAAEETREEPLLGAVLRAASGPEAGRAYRSLFADDGYLHYLDDKHTSIALHAHWESNRVAVPREPKQKHRSDWVLDRERVEAFLGVVKERIGIAPPDWWAESLRRADMFPGEHHFFLMEPVTKYYETDTGYLVPAGTELVSQGDRIAVSVGEDHASIPQECLTHYPRGERWSVLIESGTAFVARHDHRAWPYPVVCVDLEGDRMKWSTDVWGARYKGGTGIGGHTVEMRLTGDSLAVFGMESHGAYIELFDAATGESRCRFCSCYWNNYPETWE